MKPLVFTAPNYDSENVISPIFIGSVFIALCTIILSYSAENLTTLTIISICSFLVNFFLLKRVYGVIDITVIFYLLCYLFHSSYFILITTDNINGNAYLFITLPEAIQISTLKYCNYFFCLFPIGSLIATSKKSDNCGNAVLTIEQCYKVGLALMIVALLPRLYVDIARYQAFVLYGYRGTRSLYINNYILILSNMFYIGAIFAIYGYKTQKNKAFKILIISLLIAFFGMMSGGRGSNVAYLVVILYTYYKCCCNYTSNILSMLRYIFVGYFILAIIATFGDMRDTGDSSISNFMLLLCENITYKLIFSQLGEFGFAAYTLGASIAYFPTFEYGKGANYFLAWLEIFPNIGGALTGFSDSLVYVFKLPKQYQGILGGSVLGELFYNFGYFSLVIFPFFGYAVTQISNTVSKAMKRDWLTSREVLSILALMPIMLWVRSYFNEFPRAIIWSYLLICIMRDFLYRK